MTNELCVVYCNSINAMPNLYFCSVKLFYRCTRTAQCFSSITKLFHLQCVIKQYSSIFLNKSEDRDFSFLTSNTKYFLTNSSINTALLYLFVPLRTQGICEIAPSDAIHRTVRIAKTARPQPISCFVQYSAWNREKCENLRSLKFDRNIEILKQYLKILSSPVQT